MATSADTSHVVDILRGLHLLWTEQRHTDVTLSDSKHSSKTHKIIVDAFMPELGWKCRTKSSIIVNDLPKPIDTALSWLYSLPDVTSQLLKTDIKPMVDVLKIKFILSYKPQVIKGKISSNTGLKKSWLKEFTTKLKQCYEEGLFSDVTIKVEGQSFRCHKAILASVSPFFDTMFSSGMRETNADEIELQGIKKSAFGKILRALYLGEDILATSNIETLTSTTTYLQLSRLQEQCQQFLARNMDTENAIGVLRLAEMNDITCLHRKTLSYIVRNFSEIVKNSEFSTLSSEQMIEFVKDDDLNVADETVLFEAVIKWTTSCSRPVDELYKVLQHMSLLDVKQDAINVALNNTDCLGEDSECKALLESAIKDLENNAEPPGRRRNEEVLVVIRASGRENGIHVTCYSFQTHRWYGLASLTNYAAGSAFAACAIGQSIYLTGGSGNPRVFLQYSIRDNEWKSLPKFKEARSEHVAVATDDAVYVLGGRNQVHSVISGIERYCLETGTWRTCGALVLPVSDASAAVVGRDILVCGGALSFGEYTDAIQCFDTVLGACSVIANLPMQCSFTDIAIHEDVLYIVSPRGHVMEYKNGRDPVLLGNAHTSSFMDFSTVYYRDLLYIVGGTSNKSESAEMKAFDLQSHKQAVRKNVKLPWKRLSNQYFSIIAGVNRKYLSEEIKEV